MTPLELDILLHYHCRATDYRDGDFSAPAVRDTIDRFRDVDGLLIYGPARELGQYPQTYELTERARVFVDALCALPLPVARWVIPRIGKESE